MGDAEDFDQFREDWREQETSTITSARICYHDEDQQGDEEADSH
jgi:hypothetical protein